MDQLRELIGKDVEVVANGIVYRGVLKDASEKAISLLSSSGWLEIMMSSISKIREPGQQIFDTKYIDPSFYKDK
jgi:hypothetical protein